MSWGFVAVAGANVVGGAIAADAAGDAADEQAKAAKKGISEERRQFDALQELLAPYTESGEESLQAQRALLGLAGEEEQLAAIEQLEKSPAFTSAVLQGEEALLQNASATGGLRGGNIQSALAQFRPQLLANTIQQQYANLGGLTSLGQNAAAMTGNAGMQSAGNIANLYENIGDARANASLVRGQVLSDVVGTAGGMGYMGLRGGDF